MSTTVENGEPEQPVNSSTQNEVIEKEEAAPVTKMDVTSVNADSEEAETSQYEEKKSNVPRFYSDGVLKTSRREDANGNKRNNSKYDPSILPDTDDPNAIRNQVEFYFGDSNLPTDNFLWGATDGTTNLPVKVATICTFGRMKRFKSIAAVVAALRDSDFLEVTGPEGLEEVKRKYPYDPTIKSKSLPRSIYAKGFGDEEPSSQFDIEAFFTPYGPIKQVRLRRTDDKLFKGSVFVEFQDEELAEAFLKLDPKPLWKGEHVLKIKSKKEYNQEKAEEIKDGKVQPGPTHTARGGYRGRGDRGGRAGHRGHRNDRDGRDRGRHDRGDRDPDDWKKRREDDRANGFRGDRDRRQNTRGRGRGRHDRGRRDSDRNHEHEDNDAKNGVESDEKLEAKLETNAEEPQAESKKRAREDNENEEIPTKKIDSKSDVTAESS